jgi:hypothetical protein
VIQSFRFHLPTKVLWSRRMAYNTTNQQPRDANPVVGHDQAFSPRLENVPTSRVLTSPAPPRSERSKTTRRESPAFSGNKRQKTAMAIAILKITARKYGLETTID